MTNYEQKAKELIESFYLCMPFKDVKLTSCGENPELIVKMEKLSAKQCAIIAVDEIINSSPSLPILSDNGTFGSDIEESTVYWQEVKALIESVK